MFFKKSVCKAIRQNFIGPFLSLGGALAVLVGSSLGNASEGCGNVEMIDMAPHWTAVSKILSAIPANPENVDEEFHKSGTNNWMIETNLETCSADPHEMKSIDEIITAFIDPQTGRTRPLKEIESRLDKIPDIKAADLFLLKLGASKEAGMTVSSLKAHSCRAFLEWQLELGADPKRISAVIEKLRKANPYKYKHTCNW